MSIGLPIVYWVGVLSFVMLLAGLLVVLLRLVCLECPDES